VLLAMPVQVCSAWLDLYSVLPSDGGGNSILALLLTA